MHHQIAELRSLMAPEKQWRPLVDLVAESVVDGYGFDDSVAAVLACYGGYFTL
jgi:hypothetical protein